MEGLWKACWGILPPEQWLAENPQLRLEPHLHPWTLRPTFERRDRLFLRLWGGPHLAGGEQTMELSGGDSVQSRQNGGKRGPWTGQRTEDQGRASLHTELWTTDASLGREPPKFGQPVSTASEELSSTKTYFQKILSRTIGPSGSGDSACAGRRET